MLEQTAADSTGEGERVTCETRIEAPTCDDAWANLHAELPEGWLVPWVWSA